MSGGGRPVLVALFRPPEPVYMLNKIPIAAMGGITSPLLACLDAPEQFHQVPDLDVFDRTHGPLDLPAQAPRRRGQPRACRTSRRNPPHERTGSEPLVQPDRNLLQPPLHVGLDECARA